MSRIAIFVFIVLFALGAPSGFAGSHYPPRFEALVIDHLNASKSSNNALQVTRLKSGRSDLSIPEHSVWGCVTTVEKDNLPNQAKGTPESFGAELDCRSKTDPSKSRFSTSFHCAGSSYEIGPQLFLYEKRADDSESPTVSIFAQVQCPLIVNELMMGQGQKSLKSKKSGRSSSQRRYIVFDLETDSIPSGLSRSERNAAIRKLRIKCGWAYDSLTRRYTFYTEGTISRLLAQLRQAEQIVGYNIVGFDYLVLHRFGFRPGKSRTVDIFDKIRIETGNWYKLDELARLNLGRGKIAPHDLKAYCKNDVRITHDLYKLWVKSKLQYDRVRWLRNDDFFDEGDTYDSNMLEICPHCGSKRIEAVDEDFEDMTEGQMADRLAGFGGAVSCMDCGAVSVYD